MKFKKIGTAENKQTKSGKKALVLALDPKARARMSDHNFAERIWVLKDSQGNYTVMSPMPDDYQIDYEAMAHEWVKSFNQKHHDDTPEKFQDWLEK